MYSIYKITSPSGKSYIGLTKMKVSERWKKHQHRAFKEQQNHPFYNAIRKYGAESFTVTLLESVETKEQAQWAERSHITAHRAPLLYNLSPGGEADGETGSALFWERMNADPEAKAAYCAKLSKAMLKGRWIDYDTLSKQAADWRKNNPREAYKISYRAMRCARNADTRPPKPPDTRSLKERLAWKHKRGEKTRENALAQWSAMTESDKIKQGAAISAGRKRSWSLVTRPEDRRALTASARAAVDRTVQSAAASKGIRQFWTGLRKDPARYAEYIEQRKKTLAETNRRKLVQTVKTYDIINAGPNNRFLTKYGIVSNSGRIVQVQNLPRNYIQTLGHARDCIKARKLDALKLIYGNVPDTLSQLIRTAFVPSEGNSFAIADFSAIEARVVAWLAQEKWVMDVFASHGKIYEATAAQMFNVPIERVNKELRQRGKVAVLGLGYGMGAPRLKETAEKSYRVFFTDEESEDIVGKWRKANPNIVQLWHDIGNAAIEVVKYGGWQRVGFIELYTVHDPDAKLTFLKIRLPNGRELYYPEPQLTLNRWGRDEIQFWGVDDKKKWNLIKTYGAKIVENITQAVARDCLTHSLVRLSQQGYRIVFHVHDEVVVECKSEEAEAVLQHALAVMAEPIPWAPGLILGGAGFVCEYYQKD